MSDMSGRQWFFMFIGYGILLSVPMMGLAMKWDFLVIFMLMERIGKALRNPAKDTVLSGVAENQVGIGFAYGLVLLTGSALMGLFYDMKLTELIISFTAVAETIAAVLYIKLYNAMKSGHQYRI